MSQKSLLDDRIAELEKDIAELVKAEKADIKKVEKQLAAMNVEKKSSAFYTLLMAMQLVSSEINQIPT